MENEGAPQARRPAGRLDGPAARILALAIAAALAGAIAWIGQVGFAGVAMTPFANSLAGSGGNAAANSALAACLAERVGAVDQMRADVAGPRKAVPSVTPHLDALAALVAEFL